MEGWSSTGRLVAGLAGTVLLVLSTGSGCGSNGLTELVVVVDTDYTVPNELERIEVEITGPSGRTQRYGESLGSEQGPQLPLVLFVELGARKTGPVRLTARGHRDGQSLVQQTVQTGFVRGQSRLVRLMLLERCQDVPCKGNSPEQTCGASGCEPVAVPAEELPTWQGHDGELRCASEPERCNGQDDDCDEQIDEQWDFAADPTNCGVCGNSCDPGPHQSGRCTGGSCAFECDPGWADCNGNATDGCEANLATPEHCGRCDRTCGDAAPLCDTTGPQTECTVECSGPSSRICGNSCVDTSSNTQHCGDCNDPCTASLDHRVATCSSGNCTSSCESGWGDCNDDIGSGSSDGCETPLTTTTHCGQCNAECDLQHANESCEAMRCAVASCEGSWRDCDGTASNGCERKGETFYADSDGDGFGDPMEPTEPKCEAGMDEVANSADCDDDAEAVHPDATEICNGIDDDCSAGPDDGFTCVQGATRPCTTQCGTQGMQPCGPNCTWESTCMLPPDDTCDDVSDDCDGELNEDATNCGNDCSKAIEVTTDTTFTGTTCGAEDTFQCSGTNRPDHVYRIETQDYIEAEVHLSLESSGAGSGRAHIIVAGSNCPSTQAPQCNEGFDQVSVHPDLSPGSYYIAVEDAYGCGEYTVTFQVTED